MSELIVSDELSAELERVTGPVEIRAKSGRKLGEFVPEPLVPWDPSITQEELDRRMKEPGESLAEFWKRMGRSSSG
jgi:hypothetical protein